MDFAKLAAATKAKKAALKPKDKTIKPQPGLNRYVLLPGWRKGEEHVWYHDFGQHYIKNAADEIQAVYPCNEAIYGKPCPVCDGLSRAQHAAVDDETVEILKKAKASRSFVLNVLALDSEDPNAPQILEVKNSVFTQLMDMVEESAAEVFDAGEPLIFTIKREGKGLNTKYFVQPTLKKHDLPSGTLKRLHNLDEYVMMESEEQKRKALAAINSVAGLLPAASDRPQTASMKSLPMADIVEDAEPAAPRKPAKVAVAALDEDLDDLLGDIN